MGREKTSELSHCRHTKEGYIRRRIESCNRARKRDPSKDFYNDVLLKFYIFKCWKSQRLVISGICLVANSCFVLFYFSCDSSLYYFHHRFY